MSEVDWRAALTQSAELRYTVQDKTEVSVLLWQGALGAVLERDPKVDPRGDSLYEEVKARVGKANASKVRKIALVMDGYGFDPRPWTSLQSAYLAARQASGEPCSCSCHRFH